MTKNSIITRLLILAAAFTTLASAQDNLKICAIRVDFQEDTNELTTGVGKFILQDDNSDEFTIDPAPHNRSYFQDQIIAVSNYYQKASNGHLTISGDVFPAAQNASYTLDRKMGYYSPNDVESLNNKRLAELFVDAVNAADPDIDFSGYDLVVIFHAGVGKDVDVGFDETPQDIPSLYLNPGFFTRNYDPAYTGIPVDGNSGIVDRGIILPESESQEGLQIALTGIFASNVGSHLGLFDLFSASDQRTGVGRFGLMDAGLLNLFGLAPSMPSAFSRELKNWDVPGLLDSPQSDIPISRFEGSGTNPVPSVYRVPLNSSEYYLIEYRGERKINIDSVYAVMSEGRTTAPSYLEVLKTYLPDRITVSDSTGVLLAVDNYDWGLPGSGLLIWHVDQAVIDTSISKQINNDRLNRAVDVEEADGSQDIGYAYQITDPGFQSELGTWLDFWFKGNPAPLYKNEFSDTTAPNTKSNRIEAASHIRIYNISGNNGSEMQFSFSKRYFKNGFPLQLSNDPGPGLYSDLYLARLSATNNAVLTAASNGAVFAIDNNGNGLFNTNAAIFAFLPNNLPAAIAIVDTSGNGFDDILVAGDSTGTISLFAFSDIDNDQLADPLATFQLPAGLISRPVIANQSIYLGANDGKIYQYDFSGRFVNQYEVATLTTAQDFLVTGTSPPQSVAEGYFSIQSIDLDGNGSREVISAGSNSLQIGNLVVDLPSRLVSEPALSDMDDDGLFEIILTLEDRVMALNKNGALVSNMPIQPVLESGETLSGTVLSFDLTNDGKVELVFSSTEGRVFAYQNNGKPVSGFPLSSGSSIAAGILAADLDGNGSAELFAVNESGWLYGWQLDADISPDYYWVSASGTGTNNSVFSQSRIPTGLNVQELMPKNRAYNYPNPNTDDNTTIRYYLQSDASVSIKIFDLAGDVVDSFEGPGQGKIDNEISWNVKNIESGVYLCRIEAKAAARSDVKIIKIMVVH